MIKDFTEMLAYLEAQARAIPNVTDFRHVASGDLLVQRITKYYSTGYKPGQTVFLDTSECNFNNVDRSDVELHFTIGVAVLSKAKTIEEQDLIYSTTLQALVKLFLRLDTAQRQHLYMFKVIENRINQVSKPANVDAFGWRGEATFSFSINHENV